MRLSDVKGDRSFEVLAEIVDYTWNIADTIVTTQELSALMPTVTKNEDGTVNTGAMKKDFIAIARKLAPTILKTNKEDIIGIFVSISGKSRDEVVEDMTPLTVIRDVYELFTDEVFFDFLAQLATDVTAKAAAMQTASILPFVNTEAHEN